MPDEVSVRMLELPFRYLQGRQIPVRPLLEGLRTSPDDFFKKATRIDWDDFVVLNARIAEALGGPQELPNIGRSLLASEVWRPLKLILRAVTRLETVYKWVAESGHKRLLSNVVARMEQRDAGIRLTISIDEGYSVSEEYFLITKGVLEATPGLFGYAPALVSLKRDGRRAIYDVDLPRQRTWRDRLSGLLRALRLTRAAAAAEIEHSLQLLEDEHRKLKAAKLALEELNRDLERRVVERTRDLTEAIAARDRLFANLSHEFRTPLSLILLPIDSMLRTPAFASQQKRLRAMETSARRLLRLVDGILEIAANREGRLALKVERIDLAAIARRTVESYQPAAEQYGLSLVAELPESAVLFGDEPAVTRILENLLGNALKYTPRSGSVTVSVSTRGDTVLLSVKDTGVGIDPKDHARIFERFERVSEPVVAGTSSSGVGLALVKELASAHGGAVAVSSALNEGSTFEVTLPCLPSREILARSVTQSHAPMVLARQTPAPFPAPLPAAIPEGKKDAPAVLIAEDNPDLRDRTAELLAPHYRLLFAGNGRAALEILAREPVDLVLSDLVMPGMDGLELCRRLRAVTGAEMVPFILVTAVQDKGTLTGALDAGADDFLVKPFNEGELLGRVRAQLRVREMAKKLAEARRLGAMGALLSDMAHEFRNPINVLVNGLAPLRESLRDAEIADPTVAELLDALETAASRVGKLSFDLLTFRREQETASKERVRIGELIDQSLALLRPKLGGIPVVKRLDFDGEVQGSADVLGQVVMNLVENALQATSGKGPVGIESRIGPDAVEIDVWDDGPGIPPDQRERIFEPFFTTKRPGEGTGLGLAISRQIAERHGGHLGLAESDRGARFRLTLPRAN